MSFFGTFVLDGLAAASAATAAEALSGGRSAGGGFYGSLIAVAVTAYTSIYALLIIFMLSGWHTRLRRGIERAISVRMVVILVYSFFVVTGLHLASLPFIYWQSRAYHALPSTTASGGQGWAGPILILLGSIGALVAAVLLMYVLLYRSRRLWWFWTGLVLYLSVEILVLGASRIGLNGEASPPSSALGTVLAQPAVADLMKSQGLKAQDVQVVRSALPLPGAAGAVAPWIGRPRILLSESVLKPEFPADEVRFVIAHEIGHIRHRDGWKSSLATLGQILLIFLLTNLGAAGILSAFGRRLAIRNIRQVEGLPLLFLLFSMASILTTPLVSAVTRSQELAADRFALETTRDEAAAVSYFQRVSTEMGPGALSADPASLFSSHPALESRIRLARQWKADSLSHRTASP